MIHKDKYLVYDPSTDTLNMTDAEGSLFMATENLPKEYKKRLIETHIKDSEDREVSIERLEEIFMCWSKPGPLFNERRDVNDELSIIFTLKSKKIDHNKKPGKEETKEKRINKSDINEPIENLLRKFIEDSPQTMRVTRRNIAASSLWVAFNEYHKKELTMTRIATIFMENGIWTEGKIGSLQRTFTGLEPINFAEKSLSNQIAHLF